MAGYWAEQCVGAGGKFSRPPRARPPLKQGGKKAGRASRVYANCRLASARLQLSCSVRSAHLFLQIFASKQAQASQLTNTPHASATMSEAAAADADTTKVNLVSFVFCHGQFCFRGRGFPSAGAIIIIRRDSARARPTQIHGNRKRRGGGSFAFGFSVPAFVSPARYSGRSSFQWVSHRSLGTFPGQFFLLVVPTSQ